MWANLRWVLALYVVVVGGCAGAGAAQHASPLPPDTQPAPPSSEEALRAELAEKSSEVDGLKSEIERLREHEQDLTLRLKQALRSVPGKTISSQPAPTDGTPAGEATIKQLQEDLKRERTRRQQLEEQLARLKAETSSPPLPLAALPPTSKPETEIIPPPEIEAPEPQAIAPEVEPPPPAPVEVASIPAAPPIEPAPPAPPAPALAPAAAADGGAHEVAALRARGVEQETRHQEAMTQLARVLDADRVRQEDLEAQIASLRGGAPGTEGAVAADSNEVNHLRTRLEQERRRNAELAAKLKLAGRVTDLVFRMQNQAQPQARRAPRTELSQTEPGPNAPDQPYVDPRGEVNQPLEPVVPQVGEPGAVAEPEVGGPDAVEQPPVFDNQGETITEEVTQD